jgi:hypothetical protein
LPETWFVKHYCCIESGDCLDNDKTSVLAFNFITVCFWMHWVKVDSFNLYFGHHSDRYPFAGYDNSLPHDTEYDISNSHPDFHCRNACGDFSTNACRCKPLAM